MTSDEITPEQLLALLDDKDIDLSAYLDTEPIDLTKYLDNAPLPVLVDEPLPLITDIT
jgi:hypothetical protein